MTRTNYTLVARQLAALTEGIPYEVANLANASALLWQEMPEINWVGFYKMMGGKLVLGPFQGKPACIEIPVGKVSAAPLWRRMRYSWFMMFTSSRATLPATVPPTLKLYFPSL